MLTSPSSRHMLLRTPTLALALAPLLAASAPPQDFYDESVVREVTLDFQDNNWWQLLKQNKASQTNILADMTIDGIALPDVGVRIKGNSSWFFLPQGSRKASLAIDVDFTHPEQEIWGHSTLNLNNGIEDPTFCREVVFQNAASRYSVNGRASHVHLSINGGDWGIYVNVQQYNKTVLRDHFVDEDGLRWKCPNNPAGPGLSYKGQAKSQYTNDYELTDWLGHPDPWQVLIDTCQQLDNGSLDNLDLIDERISIDTALWAVALENVFMDEDSYISKGADFQTYWDPLHQQLHLHLHDANESFGVSYFGWPGGALWDLPPLFNKTDSEKPVLHRLLDVPEVQQRYFAHVRTLLDEEFRWDVIGPLLAEYEARLDPYVLADPHKLYSYQDFKDNFTQTVVIDVDGIPVPAPGLSEFVQNRHAYLSAHNKINKPAPQIPSVVHAPERPQPGEAVTVRATVVGPPAGVGDVTLYYRDLGRFRSTPMFDDGAHADGSAGDGVYGALLPVSGQAGQAVDYYVGATADTSARAATFHPRRTEFGALDVVFGWGETGVKITEYMYSGSDGEFFELTNTGATAVDLTGWSMDDQTGAPGTLDLSAIGVLDPGESAVVCQGQPADFEAAWGLTGVTVVGPNAVAPIGRNDQIHIFDGAGMLVERLTYGDEDFPGSPRAKEASATPCSGVVGLDDAYGWQLGVGGDALGSVTSSGGDVGSPGTFLPPACPSVGVAYCDANANSTGLAASLRGQGSAVVAANDLELHVEQLPPGQAGYVLMSDLQDLVPDFGGSQGNLCVGAPILRFSADVLIASAAGEVFLSPDLGDLPQGTVVSAGETWNFQLWYRDVNPTQTSNTSNGLAVTFE